MLVVLYNLPTQLYIDLNLIIFFLSSNLTVACYSMCSYNIFYICIFDIEHRSLLAKDSTGVISFECVNYYHESKLKWLFRAMYRSVSKFILLDYSFNCWVSHLMRDMSIVVHKQILKYNTLYIFPEEPCYETDRRATSGN